MDANRVISFLNKYDINVKFIPYEEMHSINSIEELMPATLILYQFNGNGMGHFCCTFRNSSNGICFFDPVGLIVDSGLDKMPEENKINFHHDFKYLTKLYANAGGVDYNDFKLQKGGETCGPWCAIRLLTSDIPTNKFIKCFKGIKNRDDTIEKLFLRLESADPEHAF